MKKIISVLLSAMLMVMILCGTASACSAKSEAASLAADVKLANTEILSLVRIAQATPYNDIAWMQAGIDLIVARVKLHAKLIGAKIGCEMTPYFIDGRWVDVDPLFVVNIRQ